MSGTVAISNCLRNTACGRVVPWTAVSRLSRIVTGAGVLAATPVSVAFGRRRRAKSAGGWLYVAQPDALPRRVLAVKV